MAKPLFVNTITSNGKPLTFEEFTNHFRKHRPEADPGTIAFYWGRLCKNPNAPLPFSKSI